MNWLCCFVIFLQVILALDHSRAAVVLEQRHKRLSFVQHAICTYAYEVAVHTARGAHSTASDGFQLHALVDVTPASGDFNGRNHSHLIKLDVREPRLRRVRYGGVIANHPVNEEFEEQLSKPFYFHQEGHGVVTDVLFPKNSESPEIAAFKKGIAGAFQLNLKDAQKSNIYEVQEHDDSGIFRAKYNVVSANDTHAHLHRTWTNFDYQQFADGTPAKGEHKIQSQHSAHVHVKDGRVDKVHRTNEAFFRPTNGHPRTDNFKGFQDQEQDIEMSTSGYSKLTLRSCSEPEHRRSKRSTTEEEHLKTARSLTSDNLLFMDTEKINWSKIGGEKKKTRPFYEVLRCFSDKSMKERDIGDCSNEMHRMVRDDEGAFRMIVRLVRDRSHQNLTSWSVYVAALAGHGKYEAQNALAQAVKTDYPRPLSNEEYEALLVGIFYLPEGPLHSRLFDALLQLMSQEEKGDEVTSTAMLVLAGLAERAKRAGYNESLSDSVAEMVHNRYRNRSTLYHPDSEEHEMQLRDHIWAFGNLGHHSGLPVILEHIDHDNSGIRSAVISALRKLPPEHTNQHLMYALYRDEHAEVKAAVVNVFVERHQHLSDSVVQGLEHALWHAPESETLDSSIIELLENHGDHPKAVYLRKRRSAIHRRKRALFPFLRPREFALGPSKRWVKTYGGKWLGAESVIQFVNQVKLRIGIFGGNFEVNLDNYAHVQAYILKFGFEVVRGKAAFKASASFKNDFPKDLIHAIADAGDDLLKQFDSITSVIAEQINRFKGKLAGYLPLYIDKFVDFVNKLVQFVQNLVQPLRPINLISKVIKFAKDVLSRVKDWKWLIDKIKKIQQSLGRLTVVDDVFKKVIAALDNIFDIVGSITKYLPHNLPGNFNIKKLLDILRSVSVDLHLDKIKDYFNSLGFSVPGGFRLQLPFKFTIHFSFSLETFQQVILKLLRFANRFLDMSSLLDFLEGIRFPRLQLPNMNLRFPSFQGSGFNFGLRFDWRLSLKFKLNLKSPSFQNFISIFTKLGDFFQQFRLPGFDLEKFFQEILPGKSFDLVALFSGLLDGSQNINSTNPVEVLQDFLENLIDALDFQFGNVSAISDITDFFQELGPKMEQFAEKSVQRICGVYKLALNSSQEFKDFGENVEKEGIQVLQIVENTTQNALTELLNFTILVDNLIDEIERNFTAAAKGFVSNSLQELTDKLRDIQNLADDIVDFANGTASKVSGACTKTANFSADVIDKVQENARQALIELGSFIGPVATKMKTVGTELKSAVTKVETWYDINLAARVGKISRVAQIISDFLSILNTKKGFLKSVREIATRINEVLTHLRNLPEYANKARKTADDIINFADRAQNYKSEIQKLDIRKQFGIDFDQRVRDVCNEFKTIAAETLNKIGSFDIVKEVDAFFNKEADKLIGKAVSKFRRIKEPIYEIQGELQEIKSIVREVMAVLIDLKPFTNNFSPILETAGKLPDCQQIKKIFLESTKPCVRKALMVGRYVIDQYKDFKKEIKVLYDMVPETWKNFKIQKCIKGGTCISKAFIDQAKAIKDKADVLKDKFKEASGYTDMLETCEQGVDNITAVVDTVKLLVEQVRNFSLKDDVQRVKAVFQKITGRKPEGSEGGGIQKRSIKDVKDRIGRIVDYIQKAKDIQKKMQDLLENTFKAMRNVYDDAVLEHVQALEDVRSKLKLSYELWQKSKNINHVLQALDTVTQSASKYADNLKGVTESFSNPIVDLLSETGELSDVVKPYLDKYTTKVTDTVTKVNDFLDKITDFLNKLQLRQRGLDLSAYKPWQDIPYCSEEVCLRSIRRSSSLYLKTIFTWKFPHLDDLSSMDKSGRWLTPGLFDDYKIEGIYQLSKGETILGMHGVSSNKGKASLLVVTNFANGVKKIVQLGSQGNPFSVKIGGVAVAREYIWISDSASNKIHSVRKSGVTGTFSSPKPSWVGVSKTVSVEGTATSVSYDEPSNVLWVTDGKGGKAYGYKLSANGDLASSGLTPDRVIRIGMNAQGMTIVRQFSTEYVCISKCAMVSGFQCKLEFHDISGGDETGENTLARVVRTPSGLESVTRVDNEVIAVAFSSGTYAEKENVELMGGDFEDRYFYLRLPILKMTFGIHENCLFFTVMKDYILRPRRLFPFGDMICGSTRKRSISQELLESDVYSEQLEEVHKRNTRMRREASDLGSCMTLFRGNVLRGYQKFFPEYSQVIIVFGIPVRLFAGAGGYYSVDYQGQVCMRDKVFRLGLIPGAWISVYAGASLSLWIVEAGITIEARLLESYFIPELRIKINKWPLKACIELKLRMTPLRIRVWLWYRFRLCIRIKCKLFGCSIKIKWCSKKTLAEWWWSAKTIDRTLFSNCQQDVDSSPPIASDAACTARQAADEKYFVQWHGFYEDTKINSYQIRVGSIQGSGDDYSAWVGSSLSAVITDLPIMHGRDVYVSVFATNDGGLDSPLINCPKFLARRKGPQIRFVYDGVIEERDADYQWDTYALGMNFAFRSDIKDIVHIKWGVSSNASCTFNEAESDIVPLTPLGDSTSIQTSGLDLRHGQKYFNRLYAMDSFGLKAVMCSDGILIDTTPPIAEHFQDGAGEGDAVFLPSLRRVRGKFDPFIDPESPIVKYEWNILKNDSNEDVKPFVDIPLTQQTPLMVGLSLEAGSPYRLVLRGTNAAGLQTTIETNGFIPDNTPPYCEDKVIDVTDETDLFDVDFVRELNSIQAKWKCIDQESDIRVQLVGVGTYPGGDDVKGFENVDFVTHTVSEDGMMFVSFSNINILPRVRYHVTVKIINGASLKKTVTSDGIVIDTTPPTVAPQYIKDGVEGKDKNYTSERFTFSAHWEQAFADTESGLVEYRVALGTKPGLADIQVFKTVGVQTSVTIVGLVLNSGQRYFVTVVGCNGVGMCINGSSNGAIVDFVPPHTGNVVTGLAGPPVLYQWITKSVWARWNWCLADEKRVSGRLDYSQCSNDSFYDVHSGIVVFGISVASLEMDNLVAPFKTAGRVRSTGRNIDLEDGVYSVVIEAKDRAGVVSRGLSNTFIVDSSPPVITYIQHGVFGETLQHISTPFTTFRSYFEVEDDLSKVATYKVGVGSYAGADDVMKFQTVSLSLPVSSLRANWTASNTLPVENNRRYFITIWATNNAGLFTIKSSPPLLCDSEAPKDGIVLDGWGLTDAQYQSYASLYRAHWYGFTDFSGVEMVYLGLSSKPNSAVCDVKKEELVPANTNYHVLFGLNLTSGQKYYACLKLVDRAGNYAFFQSNGILVDSSPPHPGYVTDGRPDEEVDIQIESSVLRASWANFTEQESKIVSYQLAFGTSPGGQDAQEFTEVGLVNTAASSRLKVSELTSGQRYYAAVIAYNVLGMPSVMVSSKGVLVDFTPPVFPRPVRDGNDPNKDLSYTSGSSLSVTWSCDDPETSLASVEIAFGLQPGEANVMNFTNLPVHQTSFAVMRNLQLGYRYFATVRCINKVGLKAVSISDGVVFDDTPPNLVYVQDGDYQGSIRNLTVNFKFVDAESGVQGYRIKVWGGRSLSSLIDVYGSFNFNSNVTTATLKLTKDLQSGRTYYVNVTAVNGVGLEHTVQSDGFTVDTSPPICSQVWDGKSDLQHDVEYAPSSSKLIISWVCYDNESPIVRYRFSVKNLRTNEYVIPFYALKTLVNSSGSAIITGGGRVAVKYEEGQSYTVGIEVINAVGLKTVNWTNGVVIDSTPPVVKNLKLTFDPKNDSIKAEWTVSDVQSGVESVAWGLGTNPEDNDIKNFTGVSLIKTSILISDVPLKLGRTYFLRLFAVNKAGLSSITSSNGVVIDRTAPNPGTVTAQYVFPRNYDRNKNEVPGSFFMVAWTGFTDPESGIKQTSWAVGANPQVLKQNSGDLYTEVIADDSIGGVVIDNQTLVGNQTYFVCIRATNGAGLHKTDCSPGMLVILGMFSAGAVSDGAITSANDVDFQLDDKAIWAHWSGFKDPVFGISRYDWCIRDQPPNPSGSDLCKWPFVEARHLKTATNRFHNLTLAHGKKYYVTVRAENSRGEHISSSSDGVVVDRTPPVGKSLQISPTTGKGILYLTTPSAPVVTWSIDDAESGISHFLIGVGGFPFQDDLLGFKRIDSLSRSIDLDVLNFTLHEGLTFHVTVTGVNMLGLKTTLTSQQVVVDWTPPESGDVVDGNLTSPVSREFVDLDYQREEGVLSAHWSGFQDAESGVVEYHWCVGTAQGACDVQSMTDAELQTSVHLPTILQEGQRYFFTVEAINGAGLKETAYSDGVTVDLTPPRIGEVLLDADKSCDNSGDASCDLKQRSNRLLAFSWETPTDVESGISSIEWCASGRPEACDVIMWTAVESSDTSVEHSLSTPLSSGTVVFIKLRVTNGAGMVSTTISKSLLIDSTAPTVGVVILGNTLETKYLRKDESVIADWSGFVDRESGLSHFEWAVCHAGATDECVTPFVNVGLKATMKNSALDIRPGVSYVLVVRAHNKVGLFSEAMSNQFILDGTLPAAGTVYDGSSERNDLELQSSASEISANWSPFTDSNGRITQYEMCVGTEQEKCDVSDFVSLGITLKGTITGLSLNHTGRYFVTVRATNEAGYSTMATSNGVRVDSTPPVGGEVRDGQTLADIDYQASGAHIYANWDEFQDVESEVTRYAWCAGTGKGICDIIPETDLGDRTSVGQQVRPSLTTGMAVFVTVSAYNGAGAVTRVSSDGVKVDSTAPVISKVLDLQLGSPFVDKDYITAKDAYCVSWETVDPESGVLNSEVSVCSAINVNNCLLRNMDVGNSTIICIAELDCQEGVEYVTRIRSTNIVGGASELSSDGFVVDSTPPIMGEVIHVENRPPLEEASQTFTDSEISVEWSGFLDKESGVKKYHLCVGTQPGECNVMNFTDVGNSTSYTLQDLPLVQGEMYFVSIKAENRAGLTSDVKSSSGVAVDKTGPINGGQILDGTKEAEDIDIQQSRTRIAAHWSAFEDIESDVIRVTWCAGSSPGVCDLVEEMQLTPTSTSVRKVLIEPIKNGQRYYITVNATNGAGVVTSLTSDGVTVDETPPTSGTVIDGSVLDVDYLNGEQDVSARWFNFEDLESGIESYEIALCDARNLSFCPQSFTRVGQATNVTITGLDLESGAQYIVIVRAINFAGLQIEATSDGFTVDFTPPATSEARVGPGSQPAKYQSDSTKMTISWPPFIDPESGISQYQVCITTVPGNCTVTDFIDVSLNTSFTVYGLHLVHGESYYAVIKGINGIGMSSEATTNRVLIDLTSPTLKDTDNVPINTTQAPPSSNNSVSHGIELPTDVIQGSSHIRFRCSEELLSANWDEFKDQESQLERYEWCVGTSKAQCDVMSLRSVGVKPKGAAIVKRLPSGTVLFATVYAVNGAGRKTRLVSEQCKVISIAPKLVEVIDIPGFNASNLTDIDWKAMVQSLSLRWEIIGRYMNDISRLRVQVAITQPSSNLSLPRLCSKTSWNSEPLVHDFMDVLSWQRNVTIRSVTLEPWERYRGVVRIWNEGGIYTDASSDGVRIEPSAPPKRDLSIRDKAAEQEPLRWLPNLRLPSVNRSALDPDVKYISSPAELELIIRSGFNDSNNRTAFILDHNLFSPTKDFKIIVQRVTSDTNETNTTEQSSTVKVIPGFANPEGPCCVKNPVDPQSVFSDTHFKATLTSQHFGASLARLPNDHFAVGSAQKAFVLPLRNRAANHITLPDDITGSSARPVQVVSYRNRSAFLVNGKAHLYENEIDNFGNLELIKTTVLGNCKTVSTAVCSANNKWADSVSQVISIGKNIIVMTGTNSSTNASVVAIFQELGGVWMFAKTLGEEKSDPNFGHSVSLNERMLAVATGEGKNSCISVYSVESFSQLMTVCVSEHKNITGPLSVRLTETDALVVVSKYSRSSKVLQLNTSTKSYNEVCHFDVEPDEYLSGNLDVNARDGGFIIALGMQTLEGRDGVQLMGFHGIYSLNEVGNCVNLGRVIARESGLRVDDGVPRTSVSFAENTILFGTPDVVTWPAQGERLGTGRVYMVTYCPTDHVRVRVSHIKGIGSVSCVPCERGRKSFGGFVEMCSVCKGMTCSPPQSDDPFSFTSSICDSISCPSTSMVDNSTNGLSISFMNGSFLVPGPDNLYTVELLETTRADVSTSSLSESFVIDPTTPEPGVVYDGLGSDPNTNCSDNSTFGEGSQCSTRSFEDTDVDFTNNTREVHARWIDFLDDESDIVEYFWCVGTGPMRDNIRECESTGMRPNGSHYELTLQQGDSYYVTVVACNGAGRCSAAYSDGVTIDTTPPVMEYVRDGIMGPDMDFQVFVDIIFAYFFASDPESDVTSYEVAWGTAPGLIDIKDFEEVTNTTIWLAKFKENTLEVGKKYYATVRATNGAGLLSDRLSSNGIVVGKSEYLFDNSSTAEFFFDTVNVNENGSRKDGGVGKTYGTLTVPEGAVDGKVKLRSYSLDDKMMDKNKTEEGPVSNPKYTRPKQFMLGNYSFVIKALDPVNNTVQEGFKFAKPITIAMFYDVDNLVKANKEHVNNEVTNEDIDPVLYLWDPENETWFDASLTCPEPWSHVNRTIKLLTVKVCHLTQFSFLWSFYAQNGLVLFDKNNSLYNEDGVVEVFRTRQVTNLEFPVRRAKGSLGDVTVQWSLYQNESSHSVELLWPTSGKITLSDGQWNDSFIVSIDNNNKKEASESVVWVQLDEATGGAVLASRDQTTAKILIAANERPSTGRRSSTSWKWIVTGACSALLLILIIVILVYWVRRKQHKSERIDDRTAEIELPYCSSMSERKKRGLTVPEIESSLTVPEMHSGDIGTARPVPKSTQMALSSELGTSDMHHVWRLEHSGDEAPSRSASVESLIDDDSDTGMRPVAGKKRSTKRRFTGLLRVASKDKYHLRPHTASTPASSDDEMETSFTTAGKGLTNPLYDAGQDCSTNNSDAESPQGLTSRGRRQRQGVPLRTVRADYVDNLDGSDSTKIEEKKSSTVQSTVSDTPTNTAEDTTMKTTNESETQERK